MKLFQMLAFALAFVPYLESAEFKIGGHSFTLPEGFTIEKVAGPGLIDRPIVADFDEEGRLYVAESSGSNDPVDKQLKEKPHRIIRLEDTDSDGVFDKSVVYADKMMFPEGTMWLDGSLYVSAPPVIWKLTDTDADGVADKREEWLDAKTLTGCANDLHGPYLGLDGWIYWCKGAFAKQTYERPGSVAFETRAAHIFRRRPEGGPVEAVMTGGMDNPVDVTFTPEGERIFTTTFFQHPGGGQRDGLIHAIYGGVYGKVHDVIDDHKKTGDLMPVLTHLGPAAPSGLTRYESEVFGREYRDNLFAALFNLRKVTRHVLKPRGATYQTEDSDFVVSSNTDFHPTDVIEDADGSLLVIDTGGWYKLCCPTSQLWKPDVLGAIYRIRRTDAPKIEDPRGAKINWPNASLQTLTTLLGDTRPAVVRRAIQQLRRASGSAKALSDLLPKKISERHRISAVWALASNSDPSAHSVLLDGLQEKYSTSVRHAALHALSVDVTEQDVDPIAIMLRDANPSLRRTAAEALGRTKSPRAVQALLRAAARLTPQHSDQPADRVEEHSIIYALIEVNADAETRAGYDPGKLSPYSVHRHRAALIALDQMSKSSLQPSEVISLLNSSRPVLKQTADWIISHRPQWASELAVHFYEQLATRKMSDSERDALCDQMVNLASTAPIQEITAVLASDEQRDKPTRVAMLRLMGRAGLKEMPSQWIDSIVNILGAKNSAVRSDAVAAAAAYPFKQTPDRLKQQLLATAADPKQLATTRLQALSVISPGSHLAADNFILVLSHINSGTDAAARRLATTVLAKAALTDDQLVTLSGTVKSAGPMELGKLLACYESRTDERVGENLLAALKDSVALSSLTSEQILRTFAKFPEAIKGRATELASAVNRDLAQQSARLEELLPKLQSGDIRRGQSIFQSDKAACSSCHAIGYLGGDLGPDLTRIGQVRTERDLLEAILYPSASFVRSYEPILVETKDGELHSGILKKDAPDELILATGPGAEVRLPRSEVADTRPGKLSVMPQGLDEQLSIEQLADLLAFLKATRW